MLKERFKNLNNSQISESVTIPEENTEDKPA